MGGFRKSGGSFGLRELVADTTVPCERKLGWNQGHVISPHLHFLLTWWHASRCQAVKVSLPGQWGHFLLAWASGQMTGVEKNGEAESSHPSLQSMTQAKIFHPFYRLPY